VEIINKIAGWLGRQPKGTIISLGVAALLAIGAADYATGIYLSLVVFYLIPVLLVSWFAGIGAGIFVSLLCAVTWSSEGFWKTRSFVNPLIPYWNVGVNVILFLVICFGAYFIKRALMRERERSLIDYLTGIGNRRYFYELAAKEMNRAQRYSHPLTVIYMDLDDLKKVNDRSGHQKGDELLVSVATTIKKNTRAMDIVSRFGGDEFVVLLPETRFDGARTVMERVRQDINGIGGKEYPVSASIGAVTTETPAGKIEELIREAEELMYEGKKGRKNTINHKIIKDLSRCVL